MALVFSVCIAQTPSAALAVSAASVFESGQNRFFENKISSPTPLPELGDGSGGTLSIKEERALGELAMRKIRQDDNYLDDWLARDYLNAMSSRLAAAARAQYIGGYLPEFHLFVVRDTQINAFSMLGGFIGVNTGLVAMTQTESELASVIGHEMGHTLQRHIARMIAVSDRSTYVAIAGTLLGVLLGSVSNGELGAALALGGQAYAVDHQLRFSRSAEQEADRVGFQMLTAGGYDPYGMPAFFDRLDRSSVGKGVPAYMSTHPLTLDRLADIEDRARRAPYRQPRQAPEFGFVRARLRVLQERSTTYYQEVAEQLTSEINTRTASNVSANWYGVALAQMLLQRYKEADDALNKARQAFKAQGSSPSLDVLAADIARRAGHNAEAVRLSEAAQRHWPESRAALESYLQALIAARRFDQAQALALNETRNDPNEQTWWRYLAQASAGKGDKLWQYRALAEYSALRGAWTLAIEQLKVASQIKTISFYDQSIVEARLSEFKARYRQEQKDAESRS